MVRSIQQLEALREEWDALAREFQNPLLDHDWFLSCAEAFHRDQELNIVTVRDGQRLTGVAPLAGESTPTGRRLMLLGMSRLYEPSGWLFASTASLHELVDRTVRAGSPFILQRIAAESPLCSALKAVSSARALSVARDTAASLAVTTTGRWETYYEGLSSHVTVNLPRIRRKAERAHGATSVARFDPLPGEVDALLDTVMAVEGSGWKARRGSAIHVRADLRDFFRGYCHRAAARRRLHVTTLSFGSQIAAVELAVVAYGRHWQLKIGYHEALRQYYPGLHLTEMSIRSAFERGLTSYEFLGSAEQWESRWKPDQRNYRAVAVYPTSVEGLTAACRDLGRTAWRRVRSRFLARPDRFDRVPPVRFADEAR